MVLRFRVPIWRRVTRRQLIAAASAVAGGSAVGLAAIKLPGGDPATPAAALGPTPTATSVPSSVLPPPSSEFQPRTLVQETTEQPAAQGSFQLPAGMAVVTSPRLPLFDIESGQVGPLLAGEIADWVEVGCPLSVPVVPLSLAGSEVEGIAAKETITDYAALAELLGTSDGVGAVALIPVDQVDFRVNVLAVDGVDPVRSNPDAPVARIGVVGDIVPGRNVEAKMRTYGDYTHPFKRVAAELSGYDLTVANLEGNLSDEIPIPDDPTTFSFIAATAMTEGFTLAGIDAVTLANNHSTWNSAGWGKEALLDTLDALDAAGIPRFGAGRDQAEARAPFTTEIAGYSVAILGVDGVTANVQARDAGATVNLTERGNELYAGATDDEPGTSPYDPEIFLADIAALAEQHDIVIPYIHGGVEYVEVPPQWLIDDCRAAIDAGASLVVTNHPHVIQGMEVYDGRPIVYSVGNFIFDQMFSVQTRQGLILELVMRGDRCVQLRTRGVEIEDFCQPRLMTAGEQAAIMDRFWASTDRIAASG